MRYCPACKLSTKHARCPLCGRDTDDNNDETPTEPAPLDEGYTIFDHAQGDPSRKRADPS